MNPYRFILMALTLILASSCSSSIDPLVGEYYGETKTDRPAESRFMDLKINKLDGEYQITGGAGYTSGRAAAPDFTGKFIERKNGSLVFQMTDSFENQGTLHITPGASSISAEGNIPNPADPRCLPLYSLIELKRK